MDDQNQTNQPLDQNIPPVVPSLPEDITPVTTPETPAVPEMPTTPAPFAPATPSYGSIPATEEPVVDIDMDEPGESPVIEPETPQAVTPFSPEPTMPTSPVEPSPTYSPFQSVPQAPSNLMGSTTDMGNSLETPNTEATLLPAPSVEETAMPSGKPKSKLMPVIGGIAALLLVFGVAGAAYYVSNQLSTRTAVAPNAPESEPRADGTSYCRSGERYVNGNCVAAATAAPRPPSNPLTVVVGPTQPTATAAPRPTATAAPRPPSNPLTVVVGPTQPTATAAPRPTLTGSTGGNYAAENYSPGDTVTSGGTVYNQNQTYGNCSSGYYDCTLTTGNTCCKLGSTATPTVAGGIGGSGDGGSGSTGSCDTSKRDTPAGKSITFSKTGQVILFTRGISGVVTLTGPKTVTITSTDGGVAVKQATTFAVTAGETYTINVRLSSESTKDSYGWVPNKAATTCGPTNSICGGNADIAPLVSLAKAESDMTGITSGSTAASIQCWGDTLRGDATQDYDFNDFTLAFGYETTQTVGACTLINVYKKLDGAYGTTALTTAQLQTLKVGDVVKLSLNSSMDSLQGRFRITVAGVEGGWLTGSIDSTNKKLVTYSDYTIEKAGTYKFEAQVTTTP